ncbi:MAG: hypothetical protein ABSH39_12055 [Candidatus Acidiferrum sp.]|jgi:hypothetical protein
MEISVQLDHLATWNEVREALASESRDAFEPIRPRGAEIELQVDICNDTGARSEELAWLRLANEALDSRPN